MTNAWKSDLNTGLKRTTRNLVLFLLCFAVLGALFYAKFGELGAALYAEIKFDEVRYGPHSTMEDIDGTLSWFTREDVPRAFVMRPLYLGADVLPVLERDDLQFVSYYIGSSGFVVVFDLAGKKLTQIKTDV